MKREETNAVWRDIERFEIRLFFSCLSSFQSDKFRDFETTKKISYDFQHTADSSKLQIHFVEFAFSYKISRMPPLSHSIQWRTIAETLLLWHQIGRF